MEKTKNKSLIQIALVLVVLVIVASIIVMLFKKKKVINQHSDESGQ